ncbi:MAG: type 4a pilus biogenesis protein PilO [Blastocatellia bacterium]|nr:type 4a pilus biogenesis protein PilO [Blastocatellia bacterium]
MSIIAAIVIFWGINTLAQNFYLDDLRQQIVIKQEELDKIKKTNDENEEIKRNAAALEQSLREAENRFEAIKPLLPPEAELPRIFDWITTRTIERNLKLEHFSQGTKVNDLGTVKEVPIQVEVLGYYDGVERLIEDFSRFERVLKVTGVKMVQQPEQQQYTTVRANISFSAYVSKRQ